MTNRFKTIIANLFGGKIATFAAITMVAFGISASEVESSYESGGVFTSRYELEVNAPILTVERVIERLVKEAVETPETLNNWALADIGMSKQGGDSFLLSYNRCDYEPNSGKLTAYLDIEFVGLKKMENVPFDCLLSRTTPNQTKNETRLNVNYTNFVLKKAWGALTTEALSEQKTRLRVSSEMKLGWFFNIFFTAKRYKSISDWRVKGFLSNLKKEAEKYNEWRVEN